LKPAGANIPEVRLFQETDVKAVKPATMPMEWPGHAKSDGIGRFWGSSTEKVPAALRNFSRDPPTVFPRPSDGLPIFTTNLSAYTGLDDEEIEEVQSHDTQRWE
jgi:hypothetical protein